MRQHQEASITSARGDKFSTCRIRPAISLFPALDFSGGDKFSTCRIRPSGTTASSEFPAVDSSRSPRPSPCRIRPSVAVPSGFTLVELLVVIGIIAVLAALVTPAVMRAQASARNAAIKAEIDMLHMAIMNYKNEYGSFPPCSTLMTGIVVTGTDPASRHITKLFPRIQNSGTAALQAAKLCYLNTGTSTITQVLPEQAIPLWLYGYNDDPQLPVYSLDTNGNPLPRKKLFDFDQSRLLNNSYFSRGLTNAPYIYIDSSQYKSIDFSTNGGRTIGGNKYFVWRNDPAFNPSIAAPASLTPSTNPQPFNPDTFQLLSAGRDGQFFTEDDISNMWNGTWRDYLDSQSQ